MGQRRTVARGISRAVGVDDQHSAVQRRKSRDELRGDRIIRTEYGGDQAAPALPGERDRLRRAAIRQNGADRPKGLDLVNRAARAGVAVMKKRRCEKGAAFRIGARESQIKLAAKYRGAIGGETGELRAHLAALPKRCQRPHPDACKARVADDEDCKPRAHRIEHRRAERCGDDRLANGGALLPRLHAHLANDLAHEELKFRCARAHILPEYR